MRLWHKCILFKKRSEVASSRGETRWLMWTTHAYHVKESVFVTTVRRHHRQVFVDILTAVVWPWGCSRTTAMSPYLLFIINNYILASVKDYLEVFVNTVRLYVTKNLTVVTKTYSFTWYTCSGLLFYGPNSYMKLVSKKPSCVVNILELYVVMRPLSPD